MALPSLFKRKGVKTHKLYKACSLLGINLLEVTQYVKISDLPEVACWGHDKHSHEQFIYVNAKTLRLPIPMISLILRHEILHAAGYDKIGGAKHHELANLVLDTAINFVLHQGYRDPMRKLAERIYPEESKQTPLALVQPHLNPAEIQSGELQKLWSSIWLTNTVPAPTSLYYKLLMEVPNCLKIVIEIQPMNPFREQEDGDAVLRGKPKKDKDKDKDGKDEKDGKRKGKFDKLAKKLVEEAIREAGKHRAKQNNARGSLSDMFSDLKSELFDEVDVHKEEVESNRVKQFIDRLAIYQQLDDTTRRITDAIGGKPAAQPYPYNLTRRSLTYVAAGIMKYFPVYWNLIPESYKPRLAVYIDTSPSMDSFKEHEVYLIDNLADYFPTKIFTFAGSVKEVELQQFAQGKYPQGSSTSFDAAIEHFLKQTDFEVAIFFTDGESSVNDPNTKNFQRSRRRLFVVYFSHHKAPLKSDLDRLAEQRMQLEIPHERH